MFAQQKHPRTLVARWMAGVALSIASLAGLPGLSESAHAIAVSSGTCDPSRQSCVPGREQPVRSSEDAPVSPPDDFLPSFPGPRDFDDFDDSLEGGDRKGTIGIVCTDSLGRTFHPGRVSGGEREAFRRCLSDVVKGWQERENGPFGYERRLGDDKGTIGKVRGMGDLQVIIQRTRGVPIPFPR
jgi:hypothetical protein